MNIFKYTITPYQDSLAIPSSAEILSVAEQYGEIVVWAKVDEAKTNAGGRRIAVVPTGFEDIPEWAGKFLGTVIMQTGLVFHIFEEKKR